LGYKRLHSLRISLNYTLVLLFGASRLLLLELRE